MRFTLRLCLVLLAAMIAASALGFAAGELTPGEARRLIANVAGISLPSDAVRVKSVSSLGSSAVVIAQVETAFRFERGDNNSWRVAEIRTGDRKWEQVDLILRALNAEKSSRARAEMEAIATALEAFRKDRGHYVIGKSGAELVDHLNPEFLKTVIRIDPWGQPYYYEGSRESFRLWSAGPDGKSGTADDIARLAG